MSKLPVADIGAAGLARGQPARRMTVAARVGRRWLVLGTMLGVLPLAALAQQLVNDRVDWPLLIVAEVILAALLAVSIVESTAVLARQDQWYTALLDKAAGAFMVAAEDGTIQYVSPASARMLGGSRAELMGRSVFDFLPQVHADDAAGPARALIAVFSTPAAEATHTLRTTSPGGEEVWLRVSASNQMADPDIRGLLINYEDITARVNAETGLRQSHDLLETAESLANVGSWQAAAGSKTPLWSAQTWRILGLDPSTTGPIDETTFDRSIHPDDLEGVSRATRRAMRPESPSTSSFGSCDPTGRCATSVPSAGSNATRRASRRAPLARTST